MNNISGPNNRKIKISRNESLETSNFINKFLEKKEDATLQKYEGKNIDRSDAKDILSTIIRYDGDGITDEEREMISTILEAFDAKAGSNGKISFDEFFEWINSGDSGDGKNILNEDDITRKSIELNPEIGQHGAEASNIISEADIEDMLSLVMDNVPQSLVGILHEALNSDPELLDLFMELIVGVEAKDRQAISDFKLFITSFIDSTETNIQWKDEYETEGSRQLSLPTDVELSTNLNQQIYQRSQQVLENILAANIGQASFGRGGRSSKGNNITDPELVYKSALGYDNILSDKEYDNFEDHLEYLDIYPDKNEPPFNMLDLNDKRAGVKLKHTGNYRDFIDTLDGQDINVDDFARGLVGGMYEAMHEIGKFGRIKDKKIRSKYEKDLRHILEHYRDNGPIEVAMAIAQQIFEFGAKEFARDGGLRKKKKEWAKDDWFRHAEKVFTEVFGDDQGGKMLMFGHLLHQKSGSQNKIDFQGNIDDLDYLNAIRAGKLKNWHSSGEGFFYNPGSR